MPYVAYISTPPRKNNSSTDSANTHIKQQEKVVSQFIQKNQGKLLKTFIELGDNRRSRHPWPELEAAVEFAINQKANLVVNEIHHLAANHSFSVQLFKFINHEFSEPIELYCCDQPYVHKENLKTIVAHAMQQRKYHGELIKEGLTRAHAKSGNPNAMKVINKVNKPKIDNAIVFSLILAPVITAYRLQGLSQRKMVQRLNEEGFCAPEGGQWVLSQLQKVLNRIKLNESALSLELHCQKLKANGLNNEKIADEFNKLSIPPPFNHVWHPENIDEILERAKLIHEIIELHEFILMLTPILEKYHIDELNEAVFASELQHAGIHLSESIYSSGSTQV